jgi:hypothetical protein
MPNITAIGVYPNCMSFCITAEIDDPELVRKVMDIIFKGMSYTIYEGINATAERHKQALKFTLLDLAKHHLYRDLEVEYVKLKEKKATVEKACQTHIYYGIIPADLKKELSEARQSLNLEYEGDADRNLLYFLQNKVNVLRKACQQADLEYNTFLKTSIIDVVIADVQEEINTLTQYIVTCEAAQL